MFGCLLDVTSCHVMSCLLLLALWAEMSVVEILSAIRSRCRVLGEIEIGPLIGSRVDPSSGPEWKVTPCRVRKARVRVLNFAGDRTWTVTAEALAALHAETKRGHRSSADAVAR